MIKSALAAAAHFVVLSASAHANEVDTLWACVSDQAANFLSLPRSSEESVQRITAACGKQINAAILRLLEPTKSEDRAGLKSESARIAEPAARLQIHDALVDFIDQRKAEMPKALAVETYFACVDDEIEASKQSGNINAIVQAIHLHCAKERQASDAVIFSDMPHTGEGEMLDQPLIDYVEAKLH